MYVASAEQTYRVSFLHAEALPVCPLYMLQLLLLLVVEFQHLQSKCFLVRWLPVYGSLRVHGSVVVVFSSRVSIFGVAFRLMCWVTA